MSFKEIIGHEKEIAYFQEVIQNKKLSHAIMLEGKDGIGKNLLAYNIAKTLFCESSSGDACGVCRNCLKMNHQNHPDYNVVEPDGKQIKNAQIEAFQEFVNIKPYDAAYKVILIKEADKMNASSQNRILKTLEEPAQDVIIILVTNNSEKLLPTVVSRCQVIKMNGLSDEQVIKYLQMNHEQSLDEALMIAKLSAGSIGRAVIYLESESFEKIRKEVRELLFAIDKNERSKVLSMCSFFTSEKENILEIIEYMILWYRDLLLYKKAKVKELLIHSHELETIKKLARNLSVQKLIGNIELLELTKKKLNQHSHFDLTIEVLLIQLLEA